MSSAASMQQRANEFRQAYTRIQNEIGKVIVGHTEIVHGVLTCLFVGGHALLEGVPGLGKTLLVRTLSQVLELAFNRIQFTPDLMPSDIIGTNIIMETPDGQEISQWQQLIREVLIAPPVQDYAIRLVLATHPQGEFATAETNKYIRCGASPRGGQALVLAGKVRALLEGRYNVSFEDIRSVYLPALRHRVLLNFEAQAENIPADTVLAQILNEVKEKTSEAASFTA